MMRETDSVGGEAAWEMFVGEGEAGRWARPIVRYWGFFFSGFVFLVVWFPSRATAAGLEVLLWIATYILYSFSLEILCRRAKAKRLYEAKLFRLFRIQFNLIMIAILALVAPQTAFSYLWFFFSMPLLATLGYFGHLLPLSAVYLEVCTAILILTFAQGQPTSLDLATMVAQNAILGLLTAVLYFFVHLSPRLREEGKLLNAATTLMQVLDRKELCQLLADAAEAGVPAAEAAVVHLLEGERNRTLVPRGSSHLDLTTLGKSPMEIGVGIAGHAIQSRETINVPDVDKDDRYHRLPPSFIPFKSLLVAPMYVGRKNVGTISVHSARRGAFGERDERFLTMLAAQGAMAIANAELYGTRERRRQQISDVLEASRTFGLNQPLDTLLDTIAAEVCRCSGYRMAVVNLVDEVSAEILVRAMAGVSLEGRRKLEGMRTPLDIVTSLLQDEFRVSGSYFIRHDRCPEIPDLDRYTFTTDLGERKPGEWHQEDMLIVPIQTQEEELLGYISIDDPSDRQLPSLDTIQALEVLASVAATAIQNARLYEEQQRRSALLSLIHQVGKQVTAVSLDLDTVLTTATEAISQSFGYDNAAIFMTDEASKYVVLRAIFGIYDKIEGEYHQAVGCGIIGRVAENGQTLLANNVSEEPRFRRLFPVSVEDRVQSELAVPIRVGDNTIGVLDVQSVKLNAFDDLDVEAMESLADQIAVAIENSRLYEAIQQELTERKRAEEALQDNIQRKEIAYQQAIIYARQLKGEITERKRAVEQLRLLLSAVEQRAEGIAIPVSELEGSLPLLYESIVKMNARFLSARDCALFLVSDENSDALELVAAVAPPQSRDRSSAISISSGCGVVAHVAETRQPIRLVGEEIFQHPSWNKELCTGLGWDFDPEANHSLLAAPMCLPDGRLVGVLVAWDARIQGDVSEFAEFLIQKLAADATTEIERLRSLKKAREDAVRAERKRLETDLHEAMNVLATGVRWEAEILFDALSNNDPPAAHTALARLQAALDRGYTDLRHLLEDLRDPTLEREGLLVALRKRAELIGRGRVVVHDDLRKRLPPEIEGVFYRVGQEAMSNALKHSGATNDPDVKIELRLEGSDGQVRLCVKDDGVGFDVESILALPFKWGLRRLRDLLHEIGGELDIDSAPGKGATICATIGLPRRNHEQ